MVLEKTQETLGTARRSDQSSLKEINPEYSLEVNHYRQPTLQGLGGLGYNSSRIVST